MSRPAFYALAITAAALLGTLTIELDRGSPDFDTTSAPPRIAPPVSAEPRQASAADHTNDWVAAILARPLFSPDRRPPPEDGQGRAASSTTLPRLAGVLVSPSGKAVFFAGDAGGKPVIVREGGRVGAFTVQVIEAGQVTVTGPEGTQVLRPVFEHNVSPPAPASPISSTRSAGSGSSTATVVQAAGKTAP